MEDGLDHLFVFPGEAAEENRYVVAFCRSECSLHRLLELTHARQSGFGAKTRPFGIDTSLNLNFEVCLNDFFGSRHLPLLWSSASFVCVTGMMECRLHLALHSLEAVGELFEEILDDALVVVAPAQNVIQR